MHEADVEPQAMPGAEGRWVTTRFADPADLRHGMPVTIMASEPGASIPFEGNGPIGALA